VPRHARHPQDPASPRRGGLRLPPPRIRPAPRASRLRHRSEGVIGPAEAGEEGLMDPAISGLIRLRNIERDDLPRMYQMQLDPESNRMAVTIPRSAEAFEAHWSDALRDPSITAKAILLGEALVGYVSCFGRDGRANVGYWVSREHWGKGIS